eukprot:14472302-Ditylum_brightwellii.AAC.1
MFDPDICGHSNKCTQEAIDGLSALEGVTATLGDAFEYKNVKDAIEGCDAAITTLIQGNAGEDGKRV